MKRLLSALLCLCLTLALPVWAAEGEQELIWKTDSWSRVYISADGGASYAELPELGREAEATGLAYYASTVVEPLPDGGLRVLARDQWEKDFSFRHDYSAGEVAAILETAVPTPVRVLSADEHGAVGVRVVEHNTGEGVDEGEPSWNVATYQTVTTTDGVHWTVAEENGEWWKLDRGWSTKTTASLGKYRLSVRAESVLSDGAQYPSTHYHIYLSSTQTPTQGVWLEDLCPPMWAKGVAPGGLALWYTPEDTVTVAAYDHYDRAARWGNFAQKTYTAAELDALLDRDQPRFSDVAPEDWFAPGVALCADRGVMVGVGDGRFSPDKDLTAPECLTLALRLYGVQNGWDSRLGLPTAPEDWGAEVGDGWWRDSLYTVQYWRLDGEDFPGIRTLCADTPKEKPVTRLTFALALAETAGELEPLRTVDALPDLPRSPETEGVYALYESGVLTGVDETGAFDPDGTLTRSQAAAMLARAADPGLRAGRTA